MVKANVTRAEENNTYYIKDIFTFGLSTSNDENSIRTSAPTRLMSATAITSIGDSSVQLTHLKSFKQEKNNWSAPLSLDNPITFTHDSKLLFRLEQIQHTTASDIETWTVEFVFPNGTSQMFPSISWHKSFQGKESCFVWGGQHILAENTTHLDFFDGWIEDTRRNNGQPGTWRINLIHETTLLGTVTMTRRVGVDPESIVFGPTFNQGSYGDYNNEAHHMDNACRNPGDKSSHICDKKKYPNERNTTIRNTGCALTSCCTMLNFYGIDVTPIQLNAWLKANKGYLPVGNIDWTRVAEYARSNGIELRFNGVIPLSQLEYNLCWYGPQVVGVKNNHHWVCLYGKDTDNRWVIQDPSGGQKIPITSKYSGISTSIKGFSLLNIPYTPLPGLTIVMNSPAEMLIVDDQGRRAGFDPITGQSYNEIPNAFYYTEGYTDEETGEEIDHITKFLYLDDLNSSKYILKVTGTDTGTYDLFFRGYQTDDKLTDKAFDKIETAPNLVHTYELRFNGAPDSEIQVEGGPPNTPDITPPVTVADYPSHWVNQNVTVTLAATDNKSGVKETNYRVNGEPWLKGTQIQIVHEGTHTIEFYSTDFAENVEQTNTISVTIDKTIPQTNASFQGEKLPDGSYKSAVTVTLNAIDNASGIKGIYYKVNIGDTDTLYTKPIVLNNEGENNLWIYAVDNASNQEITKHFKINILKTSDITPPVTVAQYPSNWMNQDINVTLSATDDKSGVKNTFYRINNGNWQIGNSILLTDEGFHNIDFHSIDYDNNVELTKTTTVKIDKNPPLTNINIKGVQLSDGSYRSPVTVSLSSLDNLSGVKVIYYRSFSQTIDTIYNEPFYIDAEGEHNLIIYAIDNAGNQELIQNIKIVVVKMEQKNTYSLLCNQFTLYGNIFGDKLYVNGSINIYGNSQVNFVGTTKESFTITGQVNNNETITNGLEHAIPQPDWNSLSTVTIVDNRTFYDSPTLSNRRFDGSLFTSGSAKFSGIIVVNGDLTLNGNVILDNACIICSGKITVNSSINGTGLVYAGSGLTIWGNAHISGAVIVNGQVVLSGSQTFLDGDINEYLKWFK